MSTNFEKKLFMPRGILGPTTAMGGGKEARIIRWYRKEWEQFLAEVQAYKLRVHGHYRDYVEFLREERGKCPRCTKAHDALHKMVSIYPLPKYLAPLVGMGVRRAAWTAGGDCTFTASTIPNLSDFVVNPSDAYTRARLHSDGDWYHNTNNTWGASKGTWQGDCTVAEYDTRWNQTSGVDTPNDVVSGSDGTWSAATVSKAIGFAQTTFGTQGTSGFSMEARDGTSLTVLFTDTFTMLAEVDAKN